MIKLPSDVQLWEMMPHLFAERMSRGEWKAYDYLHLIGQELFDAVFCRQPGSKQGGRLIVSAPPRHGKSLMISKWTPIWFLNLFPHKNVILASYEAEFAAHWGRQVRNEIQQNEDIKVDVRQDSSAADRWETPEGGGMITSGIGGALTGRGGSLILVDDPLKNWEQATSATQRARIYNWFLSTLYTRAEPGATIVLLMTRWHEDDLAGRLLRQHKDNWKEIWLPAVSEPGDALKSRLAGEALCPDRFDVKALKDIERAQGPMIWNALYRQRPSSAEGDIIRRSHFKFYQKRPDGLTMAQSWDFSFGSTTDTSSFVVGQVWGRLGADKYLVAQVRDRMDFLRMLDEFRKMSALYPNARLKLVENKAAGKPVIQSLKADIAGIVAYNPRGSKEARLISVTPQFAAGNVYVPDPSLPGNEWVRDFIEEYVNMPNSVNDDQVDAGTQMLDYWEQKPKTVGAGSMTRKAPVPR